MADGRNSAGGAAPRQLDLYSMILDVLRNLWMVVLVAASAAMLTAVYQAESYAPQYTSQTIQAVTTKDSSSGTYEQLQSARDVAQVFERILSGSLLRNKVAQKMGLDTFPAAVTSTAVTETNMIELKVTASSPQLAFTTLKTIMDTYHEVTDYVVINVVLEELQPPEIPVKADQPMVVAPVVEKVFLAVLAAGILLCALVSYLRDTVKTEQEVEQKLDTTLLETVYHERKRFTFKERLTRKKKSLLITDPGVSFRYAETFRRLCEKTVYQMLASRNRLILVTSVGQNEGKSTVAANLALALADRRRKVLLVDADLRLPAQHKIFECEIRREQDMRRYLRGAGEFEDLLVPLPDCDVSLIGSSVGDPQSVELISSARMRELLETAAARFDYVVVDSPPAAMMADSEVLAGEAANTLLVVRQGLALTRDINDAIDHLEQSGTKLLGCVYNNAHAHGVSVAGTYGGYSGYGGYGGYGEYSGRYEYVRFGNASVSGGQDGEKHG